jgi:hypothetical protein
MLIPIAGTVIALGGYAFYRKKTKKGVLTAERKREFEHAMNRVLDVKELEKAASKFQDYGLSKEAVAIRKRIELRQAPADVKAKRRDVFRKLLSSKDQSVVSKGIEAFEKIGAVAAADQLRKYLDGLRAVPNVDNKG